jgi:hypothetical protein
MATSLIVKCLSRAFRVGSANQVFLVFTLKMADENNTSTSIKEVSSKNSSNSSQKLMVYECLIAYSSVDDDDSNKLLGLIEPHRFCGVIW